MEVHVRLHAPREMCNLIHKLATANKTMTSAEKRLVKHTLAGGCMDRAVWKQRGPQAAALRLDTPAKAPGNGSANTAPFMAGLHIRVRFGRYGVYTGNGLNLLPLVARALAAIDRVQPGQVIRVTM